MEHAVNRSPLSHQTGPDDPDATILPAAARGSLIGMPHHEDMPAGRYARNAVKQPDGFMEGPTGELGINDPEPACED